MVWSSHKPHIVLLHRLSLRRQVAYSLGLVRLILVPVILLAVYYLFRMGSIVDQIVNVDAPVATAAERSSIEMLDARRAERNYFLLHDPSDIASNRDQLHQLETTVQTARALQPAEKATFDELDAQIQAYRQNFDAAVNRLGESNVPSLESLRQGVRTYQRDLDKVLATAQKESRTQLILELRDRIDSFDTQVASRVEAEDPDVRQFSRNLNAASQKIIDLSTELERRSWTRVQADHQRARGLLFRAELFGGIISAITLLVSIWVSFVLPRQVVKPLTDLREAVDHAAAGNYEIEFDVKGGGEVAQLANSVRDLIAHVREKHESAGTSKS